MIYIFLSIKNNCILNNIRCEKFLWIYLNRAYSNYIYVDKTVGRIKIQSLNASIFQPILWPKILALSEPLDMVKPFFGRCCLAR